MLGETSPLKIIYIITAFPISFQVYVVRPRPSPLSAPTSTLRARGKYDSTILYQCEQGYQLVGEAAAQCLSDGSWSFAAPVCQGEPKEHTHEEARTGPLSHP